MQENVATPAILRDPGHTFPVTSERPALSPLRKYIFLQVPEAILFVLLIAGLHAFDKISGTTAFVCLGAWTLKDILFWPILRSAYEPGPAHGTEALVGAPGVVTRTVAPEGQVRVGAELWSARCTADLVEPIEVGCGVVVEGVDGYTLLVAPRD